MDCLVECEQLGSAGSMWCSLGASRRERASACWTGRSRATLKIAPGTLRPARARAPTRCVAWRRLLMLGDFVLVALLADFLSLYAEAVKEGGLEANVSLNGAEMA